MVDCGSTNIEAINYLNKNNIKSLIIDHHEINKPYPRANVIINPKKGNDYSEYNYLCATTLTYFFLELLSKNIKSKFILSKYLIYVLLATVCDVMPLRRLNRLICIKVLSEFDITNNIEFKELYNLSNEKKNFNISDFGYLIGPILNAGGRLGKSNYATELLSSNNQALIKKRSSQLFDLNNKRKMIETNILENIDFTRLKKENKEIIIHYDHSINEGLIGIIAARLTDYFNKPSIVITNSNNLLKGSARSIHNYNIGRVIKNLSDHNIILNGGGHSMAAGFTLVKENLSLFRNFVVKDFLKNKSLINHGFTYDAEISQASFNQNFYNDIKKIEPFGLGNPVPIFLLRELKVIKYSILKKKHVSCILKSKIGTSINCIYFNTMQSKISEYLLNYKKYFNVIGQFNENFWNNKKSLQLIIKDLIL